MDAEGTPWFPTDFLPSVPVSAGALIFDHAGRLLLLNPTYKSGWTIPGGVMEADGETPWDCCRREVLEETGLTVSRGRLACVDVRPAKPGRRRLGLRYLFDCGPLDDATLAGIVVQAEEISEHRLVPVEQALSMLRKPVARRVRSVLSAPGSSVRYLEDGLPVDGVS